MIKSICWFSIILFVMIAPISFASAEQHISLTHGNEKMAPDDGKKEPKCSWKAL